MEIMYKSHLSFQVRVELQAHRENLQTLHLVTSKASFLSKAKDLRPPDPDLGLQGLDAPQRMPFPDVLLSAKAETAYQVLVDKLIATRSGIQNSKKAESDRKKREDNERLAAKPEVLLAQVIQHQAVLAALQVAKTLGNHADEPMPPSSSSSISAVPASAIFPTVEQVVIALNGSKSKNGKSPGLNNLGHNSVVTTTDKQPLGGSKGKGSKGDKTRPWQQRPAQQQQNSVGKGGGKDKAGKGTGKHKIAKGKGKGKGAPKGTLSGNKDAKHGGKGKW
jgi:hypothetical protein